MKCIKLERKKVKKNSVSLKIDMLSHSHFNIEIRFLNVHGDILYDAVVLEKLDIDFLFFLWKTKSPTLK